MNYMANSLDIINGKRMENMMNPIVVELVEKAQINVQNYARQTPDSLSDESFVKLYHEEFAKLIIYECMEFLEDEKHHGKIRTRKAAARELFKHFVYSGDSDN